MDFTAELGGLALEVLKKRIESQKSLVLEHVFNTQMFEFIGNSSGADSSREAEAESTRILNWLESRRVELEQAIKEAEEVKSRVIQGAIHLDPGLKAEAVSAADSIINKAVRGE